jgi:4-hydroxybenzoate polyprenyltransferase
LRTLGGLLACSPISPGVGAGFGRAEVESVSSVATLEPQAGRTHPRPIVRLLRPHQWTKNLLCLAGVVFSGEFLHLTDPPTLNWTASLAALMTFGLFCAASSSIYAFNDVMDRERDRRHATKRFRPVASGAVSPPVATVISIALAAGAIAGGFFLGAAVLLGLALYMANNLAYTLKFKHVALLDVLSIAIGFVLRLLAGCWAVGVTPTSWITLCTFFLAMFLGAAKRRGELATAGDDDSLRRPVLAKYSIQYLDSLVNNCAAMAIMCYSLFTIFKNPGLVVTVPIVFYGIMHYKRLVMVGSGGEEPDRVLLRDGRIQLAIVLWLAAFSTVMYLEIRHGIRFFEDMHPVSRMGG